MNFLAKFRQSYPQNSTLFCMLGFVLVCLALFPFFQYRFEGDGVSYINIATAYLAGDFQAAINAYWSPFYAWCVMPFIYFNIKPVIGLKVINIIFGTGIIYQSRTFIQQYISNKGIGFVISSSIFLMTVYRAMTLTQPDLIATFFLLTFFLFTIQQRIFSTQKSLLVGLVMAAAFFTKAYCFWFFGLYFVVYGIMAYFLGEIKGFTRKYTPSLLVFSLFIGLWTAATYQKYGELTLSTSGTYNKNLAGVVKNPSVGNEIVPCQYKLHIPTNNFSTSAWVHPPDCYTYAQDFSPTNSLAEFKWQLMMIFENINSFWLDISYVNPLGWLFLLLLLVSAFRAKTWQENLGHMELKLGLFCLLFLSGYMLIFVEIRYVLILLYLILLGGGMVFSRMINAFNLSKLQTRILLVGLCAILWFNDSKNLIFQANYLDWIYDKAVAFENIPQGSKIASYTYWDEYEHLSFLNKWQYFGQTLHYEQEAEVLADLKRLNIEYLFVDGNSNYAFLEEITPIQTVEYPDILVYRVRE